jgi:nucleoid DNA-binding protein
MHGMRESEFKKYIMERHNLSRDDADKAIFVVTESIATLLTSGVSIPISGVCRLLPKYHKPKPRIYYPPGKKFISVDEKIRLHVKPYPVFEKKMSDSLLGISPIEDD